MKKPLKTTEKIKMVLQLGRTLKFVWQASPRAALLSSVLVLVQGIFPVLLLYLVKLLVDAVGQALTDAGDMDLTQVFVILGAAAAVSLVDIICRQAGEWATETLSLNVSDHVYSQLHRKSAAVDLAFYENPAYFDTLHRAQMEGPRRPAAIVTNLTNLARNGIALTGISGLLFFFHWSVPLILFLAVIPGVLVKISYATELSAWQRRRTESRREASYLNWLLTGYVHAKEIRLLRLGQRFGRRFDELRRIIRAEKLALTRKISIRTIFAQLVSVAAVFGLLLLIVLRAVRGLISLGDLVMYYQAIQRGLDYFKNLLQGLSELYENNLFIAWYYEFMDVEEQIKDPPAPLAVPERFNQGMVLEHVSFSYPGSDKTALDDLSLTIAPGEVVALVGPNGAGKSTLARLLCRLSDPDRGRILLDGSDIRNYRIADVRRKIAVMFQDFARYYLTVGDNIAIGNVGLPADGPDIPRAAQKAGADNFIQRLPQGYATRLGKMFADGRELSGGEWQKIALARTFLADSDLIILDEPASSLDADSEYELFENFKKLLEHKSAVLISHRFSSVKMADKIIVLEQGRIVEQGSHAELLALGGEYKKWFEKQARVAGVG